MKFLHKKNWGNHVLKPKKNGRKGKLPSGFRRAEGYESDCCRKRLCQMFFAAAHYCIWAILMDYIIRIIAITGPRNYLTIEMVNSLISLLCMFMESSSPLWSLLFMPNQNVWSKNMRAVDRCTYFTVNWLWCLCSVLSLGTMIMNRVSVEWYWATVHYHVWITTDSEFEVCVCGERFMWSRCTDIKNSFVFNVRVNLTWKEYVEKWMHL